MIPTDTGTDQPKLPHSPRQPRIWVYALVSAMLVALVVSLAWLAMRQEEQRARERAELATQNLAQLVDQQISGVVDRVDIAMRTTADFYRDQSARGTVDPVAMSAFMRRQKAMLPDLMSLRMLDQDGVVRYGDGVPAGERIDLSDREFYQRARADPSGALQVSGPLLARIAKQWVVVLARRVDRPDGRFAGVVYANLATLHFEPILSPAALGEHGAATLRMADQSLVHRYPGGGAAVGSRDVSPQLRDIMASGKTAGLYTAPTALDGIERYNAYRKVHSLPMYVIVGLAPRDTVVGWREHVRMLGGLAALAVAVILLAAWLVYRSTRLLLDDISARQQLELRLGESERAMRDLYDHAPCGYHSLDAQGKYLKINATELAWLGRSRDEVVGRLGPADFVSPESRSAFLDNLPRFMRDGWMQGLELDLTDGQGGQRKVRVDANAVYDAAGRFVMSRSVMFDITALRQLEAQSRDLAREQATMLDTDLIAMTKLRDRRIVWHNRGVERIFGHSPGEVQGQLSRIFYVDDASWTKLGEAAYPVLAAGGRYRTQIEMQHKDGRPLWIDVSGVLVSPESGESLWLLADLTDIRQAERTRVLSAQLAAENTQLRETGRLKGLFLANMSHELRTPLNAVIGFAQLLRGGTVQPDSPRFANYLEQIIGSGHTLLGLIDNVLEFARVEASRLDLQPEPVQLEALIREVVDTQREQANRKRITVSVECDPSLTDIVADPLRLKQAVANYLSNAVKFTPTLGRVAVRALPDGPHHLRIEVQDSGPGMADEDLPRLFAGFQQLSVGINKHHPGVGLGLALTARLVDAQGGTVGVQSRQGQGSVFHLVLPRRPAAAEGQPLE
jgi:PAS domain S-box-containing protein